MKLRRAGLAILALVCSAASPAQQIDPEDRDAIEAGAGWQLTQQTAVGAYPWQVGGELTDEAQGAISRGMLFARDVLSDPAHLDSALATGDYLIGNYPRQFPDGDPDIFPLDVLFLHELSRVSGDPAYANFVRANLWGKLRLGIYGSNNDQDVHAWAAAIPVLEDYSHFVAMEPLYRALPAIAAHYAAEPAMADALMQSVIDTFDAIGPTDTLGDLPAIGAAVLAAVHTGYNLDPTSGRFADFDTTLEFAEYMAGFQRPSGDWPPHTGNPPGFVGDVSTTSWAIIGLRAWSPAQYQPAIDSGLAFVRSLQQPDGQILTNPGFPPDTATGVQVHAEALVALATGDGVLLDVVVEPLNQAPVAEDDTASSAVGSSIDIDVLGNDSDVDGALDPASVLIAVPASNGSASVDPVTGFVTYTPDAGFVGDDSFEYSVADDRGARSHDALVSVSVTGSRVVLTPVADTYVSAAQPGSNFGTASTLQFRKQAGNQLITFIKFDVSAQGASIQEATLRLWLTTPSGGSGTLYRASNDHAGGGSPWTESGLTWQNADLTGTVLATTGALDVSGWIEFDVSGIVQDGQQVSFAFFNSSPALGAFSSRQGAFPPELVLTVADAGPDETPPTVIITSPTSQPTYETSSATVSLGGTAGDNVGVHSVTWVNDRGGSGAASGGESWSVPLVDLQLGVNQITVTATDAAGNSASDVLTVTREAPNQPPVAMITAPANGSSFLVGQTISYSGSATDDEDGSLPASAFTWQGARSGGRLFPLAQGATGGTVTAPAPGTYIIRLTVQDSGGLTDVDEVTITVQ